MGSLDAPFNPVSLAIGAEASFVARTIDSDRKHLTSVLRAAAQHEGSALVEIYQNCNIFNDGAFDLLKNNTTKDNWTIRLEHGQPLRFGPNHEKGITRDPHTGAFTITDITPDNETQLVIHDAHTDNPSYAFTLSRLSTQDLRYTPIGVFRSVNKPTYDTEMTKQLDTAQKTGQPDLQKLLHGNDTWTVTP